MSSPDLKSINLPENDQEVSWRERAMQLERELANMKSDMVDSEERLLEALVQERKSRKRIEDELVQMTEKYEMAKQAMTSLTSKCLQLEWDIDQLKETGRKNDESMEKLGAQRLADEHCKRALDEELKKAKQQIRKLMDENGHLALRLEISEGGGI